MSSKLFATRQGTIFLGVIAAVIAAIALIVYLNQYRNSVNNNASSPVLVATHLIQAGTPGDVIGSSGFSQVSHRYAKSDVPANALVDPAALAGLVAVKNIYPGQKLTAVDFGPATSSVIYQLSAKQRAVVVPIGSPQQVGGQIGGGSHVDVWISYTAGERSIVKLLFQDVYVLGASGDNVTLRTSPRQAGQLIYASLNSQMWFDLRPTVATNVKQQPVTGLGG